MTNTDSRNIKLGIVGSLAVHLLALLVFACWVAFAPAPKPPPPRDEPVEVIMPEDIKVVSELVSNTPAEPSKPKPEPEPPKPMPMHRFMDTDDNRENTKIGKADFISNKNTTASAKKAPDKTGDETLPNTEGIKVDTRDLSNREYKDGKLKEDRRDAAPIPPPPTPVAAKPQPPKPPPPPAPVEPAPPQPEKMAKKDDSAAEKMMKELDEALRKDSEEQKVPEVRKAEPVPKMPALKIPDEAPTPPQSIPLPPPSPASADRPDPDEFAPQKRTQEVKGRISSRGDQDAVDAMATEEGRYVQKLRSALRERWQSQTMMHGDFLDPCQITVSFVLDKRGKVKGANIVKTNGNAAITDIALTSVLKAQFPPMSEDLRRERNSDTFDMTINFIVPAPRH